MAKRKKNKGGARRGGGRPAKMTPYDMERFQRAVNKLARANKELSPEDMDEFLKDQIVGKNYEEVLALVRDDKEEQAQSLAFEAMAAGDHDEILAICAQALELDPANVDARLLGAVYSAENEEQIVDGVEALLTSAEETLGEEFLAQYNGVLWDEVEARPLLRAYAELFTTQARMGRRRDAIKTGEKMLELNHADNQGVRDQLIGLYLRECSLIKAGNLLERFAVDKSTNMAWARVLERLMNEDFRGAKAELRRARKANRHVTKYLTGRDKLPLEMSLEFTPGDKHEAAICVYFQGDAWLSADGAIDWLESMRGK